MRAEDELRSLVEEIATYVDSPHADAPNVSWGTLVRHRFLGPQSPEEVVRKSWNGTPVRYFGQSLPDPMDVDRLAKDAIQALREAGMLKEKT